MQIYDCETGVVKCFVVYFQKSLIQWGFELIKKSLLINKSQFMMFIVISLEEESSQEAPQSISRLVNFETVISSKQIVQKI